MADDKLSSAELFGIAKQNGICILDCDSYKEAITTASALRNWAKYNSRATDYEIVRRDCTITITKRGQTPMGYKP